MASSNNKWEIGIVSLFEPFEEYDQYSKVGTAYTIGGAAQSGRRTIVLNSSISSDYTGDPFYLKGRLTEATIVHVPGSDIVLGPSSNANHNGAIEPATVYSVSGTTITFEKYFRHTHITTPWSAYAVGDQVTIRTIPLGWAPHSGYSSQSFGVRPAYRYLTRDSLAYIASAPSNVNYLPTVSDYTYRKGVQLYISESTSS